MVTHTACHQFPPFPLGQLNAASFPVRPTLKWDCSLYWILRYFDLGTPSYVYSAHCAGQLPPRQRGFPQCSSAVLWHKQLRPCGCLRLSFSIFQCLIDLQVVSFFGKGAWDTLIGHQRFMFDIPFPPRAWGCPEPAAGAEMALLSQAKDETAPVSCL